MQDKNHGKTIDHMMGMQKAFVKLRRILSKEHIHSKLSYKPLKTEISCSLQKSIAVCQSAERNFFKTSSNIRKLNKIVTHQKQVNNTAHQNTMKQLLTDQTYVKINRISQEQIRSQLNLNIEQKPIIRSSMVELQQKIKTRLKQREEEYQHINSEQINALKIKMMNNPSTILFRQFLIKNNLRQPKFIQETID